MYKQCKIIRINKNSVTIMISYLHEKFAKKGKLLKFDDEKGLWEISKVFQSLDDKYCFKRSNDYKNQRKESDI